MRALLNLRRPQQAEIVSARSPEWCIIDRFLFEESSATSLRRALAAAENLASLIEGGRLRGFQPARAFTASYAVGEDRLSVDVYVALNPESIPCPGAIRNA